MKSLKLILAVAFAVMGVSAMAQEINYDDPKYAVWGENAGERRDNMLNNQFLKEAVDNKNFSAASKYLKILLDKCPAASQNIYTNGAKLYKNLINAADTDEAKKVYIDSLMYLYDVRLQAFANHKKYGKDYILNRKAREFYSYYPDDREGIRKIFKEAVEASNEMKGKYDLELISIYFAELCTDYQNDEIGAEELISAYDAYSPAFDGVEDEEEVSLKNQFDSAFGQSGAASCENLEALFSKKLEAAPDDETLLGQAVTLMSRANCDSDFFFATAEKYYSVSPSSETALFLAQGFQNKGEFEKAMKYLSEALATEQDAAEKEKLYVRIGLISIQTKNYGEAVKAANEIKAINPENGYAYFILGQCYAASANCSELKCQACYWAAYDVMNKSVALLASEPAIQESAKKLAASFRSAFPTKEECFFNELQENTAYTVKHGFANGVSTTVRFR